MEKQLNLDKYAVKTWYDEKEMIHEAWHIPDSAAGRTSAAVEGAAATFAEGTENDDSYHSSWSPAAILL